MKDEPVTDWELFDKCCLEQADRRIRDKRTEILRITDPEALRTLSDRDLEEQITRAAKQAPTQEYGAHVCLVRTVRLYCHKQAGPTQQEKEDHHSDEIGEQMRRWAPIWTKDEMKTHQEVDDDLRILHKALAMEGSARPEWKDVSFECLACKYYHGEWSRLRMFG